MPSSTSFVVISAVGVKEWIQGVPCVDRLRPDRCPCCGGASRPVGQSLNIWGHGLRDRLFVGLLGVHCAPEAITIEVRRFLCRRPDCGRTFTVLPRQACTRRRYLLPTIVLALALWTLDEDTPSTSQIRKKLSADQLLDHHIRWTSWPQLLRWAEADELLMDASIEALERRRRAEQIARSYAGRSPPSTRNRSLVERAFVGANRQLR